MQSLAPRLSEKEAREALERLQELESDSAESDFDAVATLAKEDDQKVEESEDDWQEKKVKDEKNKLNKKKEREEKSTKKEITIKADAAEAKDEDTGDATEESGDDAPHLVKISRNFEKDDY